MEVTIQSPKNLHGEDLSDHYPILVENQDIKIVSYNIQLMPTIIGGVKGKANQAEIKSAVTEIVAYFESTQADICCVQELFDNTANSLLQTLMMEKGFLATGRIGFSYTNGGLRTFVKQSSCTMLLSYEYVYQNSIDYFIGADAFVSKGVIQTPIIKNGVRYQILNTHMQAYYPEREHYAEVTLAQCVELKRFIQEQIAKGLISPGDCVLLCGDFNIPGEDRNQINFLFEKMKLIMGPAFTFLTYSMSSDIPQYTFSHHNSYNKDKALGNDININVDMAIQFNPNKSPTLTAVAIELSEIYCDIQLAICGYVKQYATLFSSWHLSTEQDTQLHLFNKAFGTLIDDAEQILKNHLNPLDDEQWLLTAVELLKGPERTNHELQTEMVTKKEVLPDNEALLAEDELTQIAIDKLDLKQCQIIFDSMLYKLRKIHRQIHADYRVYGDEYKPVFLASLKLNHALLKSGESFFNDPTPQSFYKFKTSISIQFAEAEIEFSRYPFTWSRVGSILKILMAIVAIIALFPFVATAAAVDKFKGGSVKSFFAFGTPQLGHVREEFENSSFDKIQP